MFQSFFKELFRGVTLFISFKTKKIVIISSYKSIHNYQDFKKLRHVDVKSTAVREYKWENAQLTNPMLHIYDFDSVYFSFYILR